MWNIEHTDEFTTWWNSLTEKEQAIIHGSIILLMKIGPNLPFPHSSGINGSKHSHMRELRIQYKGKPYRILYAFDPRRVGILLIGGNKTGDDRWYKKNISIADKLYDKHLKLNRSKPWPPIPFKH